MDQKSKPRHFTPEFRASALRRYEETANVSALCRELGVSRQLLYSWRESAARDRQRRFIAVEQRLRQENAQLKKVLLQKTLEVDFFKAACEKVEALSRSGNASGETASGKQSAN